MEGTAPEIERRQLVIYKYEAHRVQRDAPPIVIGLQNGNGHAKNGHATNGTTTKASNGRKAALTADESSMPRLPLPGVPDSIREGGHYVSLKVDFVLALPDWGSLHWTAILDVETLAVLYVRPHVDDVTGLVFDIDPVTTNGGPSPSATSAALNPVRVAEPLLGLNAPSNGTQSLAGDTVALVDSESPTDAAPTEPGGTNFDFDARTNGFSAVNAYVHCDRFFRLVDSMGFTRPSYFGGTSFPSSIDHRGSMNTGNGIEINAHCVGTTGGAGIARTTFALADTGDTASPDRHRRRLPRRAARAGRARRALQPRQLGQLRLRAQRGRQHRRDHERSRFAGARPVRHVPVGQHRPAPRPPAERRLGMGG